jgi:hypothetical protein
MNRSRYLAVGAGAIALLLSATAFWRLAHRQPDVPREPIAGGDGGGLPRVSPLAERIDAEALERAARDPAAQGLRAFVVMRDDYVVFERYAGGVTADSTIDGGAFAQALLGLTVGVATGEGVLPPTALPGFDPDALRAAIESGSQQPYAQYLSRKLWRRLNAHPAWIERAAGAATVPADCCVHARVLDWMRVASLFTDNGRFEGKQLLPAGWVQRMQRPVSLDAVHGFGVQLAAAAQGAEPFATAGVFFVRGPQRWRLWLIPTLKLAVLFGADLPSPMDETRLPNLVIRAVSDRPAQPGDVSDLQRLVPAH